MPSASAISTGDVLAEVARMRRSDRAVVPLHTGEPDFATPAHIVEAGVAALRQGRTHYTQPGGTDELRSAVVEEVRRTRGLDVRPEQVIVTPGAKMALHVVMQALCEPGDEVIYLEPAYAAYPALARLAGASARAIPVDADRAHRPDLERLASSFSPRTRVLVLNSPCNPTGWVLDEGELGEIAAIVRSHPRTLVISDEIYSRIVYGVPFVSPASDPRLADRTVIVDGVSKTYAMTGWRVGWAVVPPDLVPAVANVALDTFFCVSGSDQTAATEALCGPQDAARTMVATYRERRDRMIMGVNAIPGLRAHLPDGAFYAWVDARSHGMMSGELSMRLLTAAGVATYPGTAFGDAGEGFVRLTFATSEANIATGLERIASALRPAAAWRSYR